MQNVRDMPARVARKSVAETADQTVMTPVRFAPDVLARIEAHVGKGKRAEFIREAVERELQRREAEKP